MHLVEPKLKLKHEPV